MSAILSVKQHGFSHLRVRGREGLIHVLRVCCTWGFVCGLIGGWGVWIDRYEIAIVGFLFGALFRLTWEGTGYEVVVDPDKISVHTSSTLRVHEKSVIKELVARTPRSDHLLLRIDWMEKKKRPLMAYGHVEDPETKLNELSQHYKVVRLEEPQVS